MVRTLSFFKLAPESSRSPYSISHVLGLSWLPSCHTLSLAPCSLLSLNDGDLRLPDLQAQPTAHTATAVPSASLLVYKQLTTNTAEVIKNHKNLRTWSLNILQSFQGSFAVLLYTLNLEKKKLNTVFHPHAILTFWQWQFGSGNRWFLLFYQYTHSH